MVTWDVWNCFCQIHNQNAALAIQDFQDMAASFFVQQSFFSDLRCQTLHFTLDHP